MFEDIGDPKKGAKYPAGYKKIRIHVTYDVKNDGRHRARVVANGQLTLEPVDESVYSGVVTLRGMKTVMFVAELNGLKLWNTDIQSAYLNAYTTEPILIVAGPKFGEKREGHLLIIRKALYGLQFSGKLFGELVFEILSELGFTPSKAESQIWMREADGKYEYVATYVDDLLLAMDDPKSFIELLTSSKYNLKFKGTSKVDFHLGADFGRDPDCTLFMSPKRYIERIAETYKRFFGEKPSKS